MDNGQNNNNNSLSSTKLFENYNDIFITNNSVSNSGDNYTSNSNVSFGNLVNMSAVPANPTTSLNNNINAQPTVGNNANLDNNNDIEVNVITPQPIISNNPTAVVNNNMELNNQNNHDRIEQIKRKENNNRPVTFNDGLDEDINYNRGIRYFLTNKKVSMVILSLIFMSVCIVVAKAFYFRNKVDKYEEFFTTIDKKIDEEAHVYASQELDNNILKKVAASELVNCISTKLDTNNLPDSIKVVIRDINNYYNQSYNHFAFVYKDIYTGFTVSYNENQNIFTASTIKAPTDIYIYEMASMGKINLDEELTYTPKQYVNGSGSIQYNKMYTKYKTRDLLKYSTVYSDNIAHNILMDNYGRSNMLDFWTKLGTTAIFKQKSNWGNINAHDAVIYMSELYRFYTENDEYGNQLMNNFMNAVPKFIKGKNGYVVANKSGWTGSAIHDVSIIFADNPYIIVALSNTGNGNYTSYFNSANDLAYRLHTEYWKYKMSLCDSIKQY